MKFLLSISFTLLSIAGFGQLYQNNTTTYGVQWNRIKATIALNPPSDTVTNKVLNSVASINGVFYVKNTFGWDAIVSTGRTYSNPSWLTTLGFNKITSLPSTLSGYGITDAGTLAQQNINTSNISSHSTAIASNTSSIAANTTALLSKVEYLTTIEDMINFSGSATTVVVKHPTRGGTFTYYASQENYSFDNGVVFNATGKGSGFWVRNYDPNGFVHILWFDADPTLTRDNSAKFDSINAKYPNVWYDKGYYKGQINNDNSHRHFHFESDAIDGGVIHLAIGTGPELNSSLYPYVTFVTDVKVTGKLKTTGRLGTYYCKDVYVEEVEILKDSAAWTYTGQTPVGSRGIDLHYGTQDMYIGKATTRATQVGGGYGLSANSGSLFLANDSNASRNIYIGQLIVDTSAETGLDVNRAWNVIIPSAIVKSYGARNGGYYGASLSGCYNCNINVEVRKSYNSNASGSGIILQGNRNSNFNFTIKNIAAASGLVINNSQSQAPIAGLQNENVTIQNLIIDSTGRAGLSYQGSGVNILKATFKNTNYTNANTAQIAIVNTTDAQFGNVTIIDSTSQSAGISLGANTTGVKFTGITDIITPKTNGVIITGSKRTHFNHLRVKGSTVASIRYEGNADSISINKFESITPTTRDINNVAGTNVSINYPTGTTFFTNPNLETGFAKIGTVFGSAAPTTLQHYAGEVVYNNMASASNVSHWICTVSGTPGTWSPVLKTYSGSANITVDPTTGVISGPAPGIATGHFPVMWKIENTGSVIANNTSVYGGANTSRNWTNAAARNKTFVPNTDTIRKVYLFFENTGALGSAETTSMYIRVNNTTDYLISSAIQNNAITTEYSNTSMNSGNGIPLVAGDYFEVKWVTAWATPPTTVRATVLVYAE